jgi:AAA15 family ATPase/GTPase
VKEIGKLWDMIVLTPLEELFTSTLREVNAGIQRISMIDDSSGARRVMAKMAGSDKPVPVQSLGDGAMRFLGIGAAIVNARNGFLLIDEFENGLHFTTQEALWRFVIRMSRELNVQVFATTHSQDCIGAFGRATKADLASVGMLFRLEEFRGEVVETHFDEESIATITENLVEIR